MTILVGDCKTSLRSREPDSVQVCVTSPPYWGLRDYGIHHESGAVGLEETLDDHLEAIVQVFREVRRVLRPDGTLWLNYGDAYAGVGSKNGFEDPKLRERGKQRGSRMVTRAGFLKPKDLMGLPWRVAFALQDDGWWLRRDIIWHKPNPMPESVEDRPTAAHEYMFLMSKSESYFYDAEAIKEEASTQTHPRGKGNGPKAAVAWPAIGPRHRDTGNHVHGSAPMKVAGRPRSNSSFQDATRSQVVAYRNKRDVWTVQPGPFDLQMCNACKHVYTGAEYRTLPERRESREAILKASDIREKEEAAPRICQCGRVDWLSHFATFPEALVEPCILAGSSAVGGCMKCGAPWVRIVEADYETVREAGNWLWRQQADAGLNRSSAMSKHGAALKHTETMGWKPSCECGEKPVPQVALDPFFGSGTVGVVAKKLGRDFLGCELNEDYVALAKKRLGPVMNHRIDSFEET